MNSNNKLNWIHIEERKFDALPEKPAIYLIVVDTINKNYLVVYTGQTGNIKEKAKQHWSESEPNRELKILIRKYRSSTSLFYALDKEDLMNGHEKALFDRFEPQLQSKVPDAEPIDVDLPDNVIWGRLNKRYFE